jgi:hypothetical protein
MLANPGCLETDRFAKLAKVVKAQNMTARVVLV